jgi:hypothetical protein
MARRESATMSSEPRVVPGKISAPAPPPAQPPVETMLPAPVVDLWAQSRQVEHAGRARWREQREDRQRRERTEVVRGEEAEMAAAAAEQAAAEHAEALALEQAEVASTAEARARAEARRQAYAVARAEAEEEAELQAAATRRVQAAQAEAEARAARAQAIREEIARVEAELAAARAEAAARVVMQRAEPAATAVEPEPEVNGELAKAPARARAHVVHTPELAPVAANAAVDAGLVQEHGDGRHAVGGLTENTAEMRAQEADAQAQGRAVVTSQVSRHSASAAAAAAAAAAVRIQAVWRGTLARLRFHVLVDAALAQAMELAAADAAEIRSYRFPEDGGEPMRGLEGGSARQEIDGGAQEDIMSSLILPPPWSPNSSSHSPSVGGAEDDDDDNAGSAEVVAAAAAALRPERVLLCNRGVGGALARFLFAVEGALPAPEAPRGALDFVIRWREPAPAGIMMP